MTLALVAFAACGDKEADNPKMTPEQSFQACDVGIKDGLTLSVRSSAGSIAPDQSTVDRYMSPVLNQEYLAMKEVCSTALRSNLSVIKDKFRDQAKAEIAAATADQAEAQYHAMQAAEPPKDPATVKREAVAAWAGVKPLLEKAVKTNVRADIDGSPENWFPAAKTVQEKAEMVRLYVLGTDGSYTDAIEPGIGMFWGVCNEYITQADSDSARLTRFRGGLQAYQILLSMLDEQISMRMKIEVAEEDGFLTYLRQTLGREPTDEDKYNGEYTRAFRVANPKYDVWPRPGFTSTQVSAQKGDRDYDHYHAKEIAALKAADDKLAGLKGISEYGYKVAVAEAFAGPDNRIGFAQGFAYLGSSEPAE
ncbi:MAG: hypothetical protein AAB817_00400 [Patescibacteria group bacterium]